MKNETPWTQSKKHFANTNELQSPSHQCLSAEQKLINSNPSQLTIKYMSCNHPLKISENIITIYKKVLHVGNPLNVMQNKFVNFNHLSSCPHLNTQSHWTSHSENLLYFTSSTLGTPLYSTAIKWELLLIHLSSMTLNDGWFFLIILCYNWTILPRYFHDYLCNGFFRDVYTAQHFAGRATHSEFQSVR